MNEDIVCLLQELDTGTAVDVVANFLIRNPETEDLIAARMGALLSTQQEQTPPDEQREAKHSNEANLSQSSSTCSPLPRLMNLVLGGPDSFFCKMIFVVNMGLPMGRGKQCAQVAHAALGLYLKIQQSNDDNHQTKILQWLTLGEKKIVVKGNDTQHLERLRSEANQANLPNLLVSDAGCTQIAPGSKTVLAIFGTNEELDRITGSLKLL